jgi:outer membrane protein assembly factor BamA
VGYEIDAVQIRGNEKVEQSSLLLNLETERSYRAAAIVEALIDIYQRKGFAFAHIETDMTRQDSLYLIVDEGPYCQLRAVHGLADTLRRTIFPQLPQMYDALAVNASLELYLEEAVSSGLALLRLNLDSVAVAQQSADTAAIALYFSVANDETIVIDNFYISGADYTRRDVILREIAWSKGQVYTPAVREGIKRSLDGLQIFARIEEPRLSPSDSGVVLFIEVEEGQSTTFDGIVGYVPGGATAGSDDSGYFTGLLDLNFANLFASARKLAIEWRKPDRESDTFSLRYKEPWLFSWPVNGNLGFYRRVQDTLFIKQGYELGIEIPLDYRWHIYASFAQDFTRPDSLAAIQRSITRNTQNLYSTGVRFDARNFRANPSSGMYLDLRFTYGDKQVDGPPYLLAVDSSIVRQQETQTLAGNGGIFFEIFRRQVAAVQVHGAYLNVDPGAADDADLFWFGGTGSLRGYRENQFRSDRFAVGSIEYRFLTGIRSRLFAFLDAAVFAQPEGNESRIGYGFGIRQETALGTLAIDYGLGQDDTFSQGKIHIGLVNEL